MAQKQAAPAPALFMVALLLFSAATPTAYGQGLLGQGGLLGLGGLLPAVPSLVVPGGLCCSPTGICNGTTPALSGVPVRLVCSTPVGNTTVGQGVTGANGSFLIAVSNILSLLGINLTTLLSGGMPMPCVVTYTLPLNGTVCPLLPIVNGTLVSALTPVNALLTSAFGLLMNLSVPITVSVG